MKLKESLSKGEKNNQIDVGSDFFFISIALTHLNNIFTESEMSTFKLINVALSDSSSAHLMSLQGRDRCPENLQDQDVYERSSVYETSARGIPIADSSPPNESPSNSHYSYRFVLIGRPSSAWL